MSKSYFLQHQNSLNLESGTAVDAPHTELPGNSKAAFAINSLMSEKESVSKLIGLNLEAAAIDSGMRSANLLMSGMLQRPDIIKYNAESYANQGNEPYRGMTVDFNFGAATQDEFGEAFYRTVTINPEESYIKLKVSIPLVYDMYQHTKGEGKQYRDLYKSVIHAYVDDSILSQSVTDLVPNADIAEFSEFFVDAAVAGNKSVTVDSIGYNTRPLKTGVAIDLLSLATPTGAVNKNDATDTIAGLEIKDVVYTVEGSSVGIRLPLGNSASTGFIPAQAGVETDYQLQNLPLTFSITEDTLLDDGSELSAVADFGFLGSTVKSVQFSQRINGHSNFQTGSVLVGEIEKDVRVLKIIDMDGDEILPSDAAYEDIADAMKSLELVGWTPKAVATNLNRRKQGRLLDIVEITRNIPVIYGQPMSIIAPTLTQGYGQDHFRSIENLTKMQRVVNSNNAVKTLLNDFVAFAGLHNVDLVGDDNSLPGIAHFYMRPWAEQAEIDVATVAQSTNSFDVRRNIEGVITNALFSQITRAYQESRYVAAKSWFVPADFRPTVIVGTDAMLINYISTGGDLRTFGPNFNIKLVATANERMHGLIVWTFGVSDVAEPNAVHPLESGIFAWAPELVGTATINRGGSTNTEAIVVPRTRHFKNTPVMGIVKVINLAQALESKLPFTVDGTLTLLDSDGNAVTPAAPAPAPTPTP